MLWIFIVCSSILLQTGSCFEDSNFAFANRDGKGWGWGSETSSKFFDIALTALAFLSFGVFLLNLLLNALMFPSTATTALTNPDPILTMITGGTTGGAIITGHSISGKRSRPKRAIFSPEISTPMSIEFMTSFITRSIDTMARKHECLPRVLCDGNRQSRVMGKGFQILFPMISITLSYIGKFLGLHNDFDKHMTAIVLGSSEANCQKSFPNCNKY